MVHEHSDVAHHDGAGGLILVVEDNPLNARLTCAMLHIGGYRTHTAADGLEGLVCASELRPDLILTDLQMPTMDGLAMTSKLKADPRTAMIPILALTAHALPDYREQVLAAGCAGFLTKPIRLQPFLLEIRNALRHACLPTA